jgi:hypothetical protein
MKWDWKKNSNSVEMNAEGIVPDLKKMQCVPIGFTCTGEEDNPYKLREPNDDRQGLPKFVFQEGEIVPGCYTEADLVQRSRSSSLELGCKPGHRFAGTDVCLNFQQ